MERLVENVHVQRFVIDRALPDERTKSLLIELADLCLFGIANKLIGVIAGCVLILARFCADIKQLFCFLQSETTTSSFATNSVKKLKTAGKQNICHQ